MKNKIIDSASGTYYVSSYHLPVIHTDENAYCVIYADITSLSNFARTINMFLIILVCAMFIAAVFVAFFLSNSITNPIKKLCLLAMNIGRGDFAPKDHKFKDREFEDLNFALNKSAKQLRIYDTEQKAFFQNVSHELRTPLMSIQCYAEGISCGLMEPKKASETILQETIRLNEMVKDLLYISKIDNITSTYTVEAIDLTETIRECARRQQAVADRKNLRFLFDFDEPAVYFDCAGELVSRAIENLISNAIRYARSKITVSCRKTTGKIEICVTDDGDGIGTEIMPHIFERFYKGEDGNHGIGLSIVKSIAEQHGGAVNAENIKDGGAAFTITVPVRR
jgi:signal transduction histidine kinase